MANDSYEISIKGAGGSSQSTQINTSNIQKSIDQVASDLKKLDTSNFQKSIKDLTQGIRNASISATNFVSNMQKIEAQISSTLKAGLNPGMGKAPTANQVNVPVSSSKKSEGLLDSKTTEKFTKSMSSLSDAIDKLTSGIKENFKAKEKTPEAPEKKDGVIGDVKKLLAAVGVGSLVKQVAENEFVNPARNAGMLISSNVVSNPGQIGSQLLSSYGNRVAGDTGSILGGIGAGAGAALGSIVPGIGTLAGAAIGYGAGNLLGGVIGQTSMAPETAIQQRALQLDYYSNLSKQVPQYGDFAKRQYPYAYGETGQTGFMSNYAAKDPYYESRATLGQSFSRFAGDNLSEGTTTGILKSLTAQGASSSQEVSLTGSLLGQIARFTGKSSNDIEKVYKAVEKSGLGPNEGLQKALSLLQSGASVKETTDMIRNTSQRTEAYNAGQINYMSESPYQQFTAQLTGHITGVDQEKFFNGTPAEMAREQAKARKIFQGAAAARRKGILTIDSHMAQLLETGQHIMPSMADNNLKVAKAGEGGSFISPGEVQSKIIQQSQSEIDKATKGRSSREVINEALTSIGNSTTAMGALGKATGVLTQAFEEAAKSFFGYVGDNSPLKGLWQHPQKVFASPTAPHARMSGG